MGAGRGYGIIGALPKNATVRTLENDSSGSWVRIEFPPNSLGRGWLPVDKLYNPVPLETPTPPAETVAEVLNIVSEPKGHDVVYSEGPTPKRFLVLAGVAAAGIPLMAGSLLWSWMRRRQQMRPLRLKEVIVNTERRTEHAGAGRPEEILRGSVTAFSSTVRDSATGITAALERLAEDFGQALSAFSEEQRTMLRRQEEVLEEVRGLTQGIQTHAEMASRSATGAESSRERANEVVTRLEGDREGLNQLINDLRSRIAALSILVAPLPRLTELEPSQSVGRGQVPGDHVSSSLPESAETS